MAIKTKLNSSDEYIGEMQTTVNGETLRVNKVITKINGVIKTIYRYIKAPDIIKGIIFIAEDRQHIVYTSDFSTYTVVYTDESSTLNSIATNGKIICAYKMVTDFYQCKCVKTTDFNDVNEYYFSMSEGTPYIYDLDLDLGVVNSGDNFYMLCDQRTNANHDPTILRTKNGYTWDIRTSFRAGWSGKSFTIFQTYTNYQGEMCKVYNALYSATNRMEYAALYWVNGETEHDSTSSGTQVVKQYFTRAIHTTDHYVYTDKSIIPVGTYALGNEELLNDSTGAVIIDADVGGTNYRASTNLNTIYVYNGATNLVRTFTLGANFKSFIKTNDNLYLYDSNNVRYTLDKNSMTLTNNGEAQYVPLLSTLDQKPTFITTKK